MEFGSNSMVLNLSNFANEIFPIRSFSHHGVVLDVSSTGFDQKGASFGSFFVDKDDPETIFLFYSGSKNNKMIGASIGLATSSDRLNFRKEGKNPILIGSPSSFCHIQAVAPVVMKLHNRFYMILSGKPSLGSSRRIGIAYADDPRGPWRIIGELIRPIRLWEGSGIDNGPSVVKIDNKTVLLYYSSITSTKAYDLFTFLRRYPIRRIGLLKIRIQGTSLSSIETLRYAGNPLKHLNGPRGSWNESVFCPGHIKMDGTHYLFPTASTYSVGFPYKQYLGMAKSNSPYFHKNATQITKLIDGPKEKSKIIPNIKSEIALDTPAPYFDTEKRKLFLYYSVADRANEVWKIALTTFDLNDDSTNEQPGIE